MRVSYYIFSLFLSATTLVLHAQSSGKNYIRTCIMLDETENNLLTGIQYFDGMGRPTQNVQKAITPSKADLITLQEYDTDGRQTKQWIPTPFSGNSGYYVADFTGQASAKHNQEAYPFSETVYDDSPLNRVSKQIGCGDFWRNGNSLRGVSTRYTVNDLEVISYSLNGSYIYRGSAASRGQLLCTTTVDEEGHIIYAYTDKLGRTILVREMNGAQAHDTYYIYDDLGNKACVLPPLAVDGTSKNNTYYSLVSGNALDKYAYFYKYDERNRCFEKKLPGAQPIYYVYDKTDRLTLSQDGNQRTRGVWTVYKYDRFGRTAYTCEVEIAETFASLRNTISQKKVVENFSTQSQLFPMGDTGYSRALFPFSATTLLTVNYYDDYSFLNLLSAGVKTDLTYQDKGFDPRYDNARGLLTGTRVYNLGGLGGYKVTAFYYDCKGNVVQQLATNHLEGVDKEYYQNSFTGKPLKYVHEHIVQGKSNIRQTYVYDYDHADRLVKARHSADGIRFSILASNTYDELGRLSSKNHSSGETVSYNYNIRNWITGINTASGSFRENIDYSSYYNGNIRSIRWNAGRETNDRQYYFTYDGLNRMKKAGYTEYSASSIATVNNYDVEIGSYDKQGNIRQLIRRGMNNMPLFASRIVGGDPIASFGIIDNLTLNYNGNQLKNISDAAVADPMYKDAMHFIDGADQEIEYIYDKNGNMVSDLNKGIESIAYNIVNQPERIRFKQVLAESSGIIILPTYTRGVTAYNYDAAGAKLRTTYITETEKVVSPGGYPVGTSKINSTTDYCGNIIYENGVVSKILVPDGYLTPSGTGFNYHNYIKDHQGNIRVVMNRSRQIEQVNHYYPFGGLFAASTAGAVQNYKYSGKELDRMNGLDLYDFSARAQDPVIGGFTSRDPLCEKYYSISPYVYCLNNPVRFIDPSGMDVVITGSMNQEAVQQIQSGARGIKLTLDDNGNLCYTLSGRKLNDYAKNVISMIDNNSTIMNIIATDGYKTSAGNFFVGGAFMGNKVSKEANGSNFVWANQEINPKVLGLADEYTYTPGKMVMHELSEAYQGALMSKETGVSSPRQGLANSMYEKAHKKATPQTPINEIWYDKYGNITTNIKDVVKVEDYVETYKGEKRTIQIYE